MNLHQNTELFKDAVLAASQQFKIPEIYVEKDYWVTLVLHEIFNSDTSGQIVFKGGTCLSKCHQLIQRFSEDIDLVVFRNQGENDNQLKKKIRDISNIVGKILPEIPVVGLTNKKGNIRKTVHQYNRHFAGNFGQVRDHLVIEATWLGNFEPFTIETVGSYILDVMNLAGQESFIEEYGLQSFKIKSLSVERTFCEKIMSLVRFSRTDDPFASLANKIRHVYDLHLMLRTESISTFFKGD
jgi:predicted nucleotidyltransferase component of viral defense system